MVIIISSTCRHETMLSYILVLHAHTTLTAYCTNLISSFRQNKDLSECIPHTCAISSFLFLFFFLLHSKSALEWLLLYYFRCSNFPIAPLLEKLGIHFGPVTRFARIMRDGKIVESTRKGIVIANDMMLYIFIAYLFLYLVFLNFKF